MCCACEEPTILCNEPPTAWGNENCRPCEAKAVITNLAMNRWPASGLKRAPIRQTGVRLLENADMMLTVENPQPVLTNPLRRSRQRPATVRSLAARTHQLRLPDRGAPAARDQETVEGACRAGLSELGSAGMADRS